MIPLRPAAKTRGRAKLALRRLSMGYTSARTQLADSPASVGRSPGRNAPPAGAYSAGCRLAQRAGASPELPRVRLVSGCSTHCPSRWSIAGCGPSAPTPEETPSTLSRSGPNSGRRHRPQSGQRRHSLESAASGRHPRHHWGRSTRPGFAPPACPDKARSGRRVVRVAPHRVAGPAPGHILLADTPGRNPDKAVARPAAVHSPTAALIARLARIVCCLDCSATIPDHRAPFAARKGSLVSVRKRRPTAASSSEPLNCAVFFGALVALAAQHGESCGRRENLAAREAYRAHLEFHISFQVRHKNAHPNRNRYSKPPQTDSLARRQCCRRTEPIPQQPKIVSSPSYRLLVLGQDAGNQTGDQCRAHQLKINTEVSENTSVLLSGKFLPITSTWSGSLHFGLPTTKALGTGPTFARASASKPSDLCGISLAENYLNSELRRQRQSWRLWVCTVAVVSNLVPSISSGCSKLTDIEHVVILIQENRSFDHYFGSYRGVRGFSDQSAAFQQPDPANTTTSPVGQLLPFHLDTSTSECGVHARHQPRLGAATSELGQRQDGRFCEFASTD